MTAFIIIEPNPVVCMDIDGTLRASYPQHQVVAGASLSDVGQAIYNCGQDSTLIVRGSLVSESDDLLRVIQAAATRGCRIVIIGRNEGLDFPAAVIDLPFTTAMMIDAVEQRRPDQDVSAAQ